MADEAKKADMAQAEAPAEKVKKKKLRPTNCVQSNKRIRRKDWYYRDGKYFANKKCYKLYVTQEAEKAKKAKEAEESKKAEEAKKAQEAAGQASS